MEIDEVAATSGAPSVSLNTGHRRVDEAMAAISELGDADLADHVTTFERAHEALRSALTSPTDVASEEDATLISDV